MPATSRISTLQSGITQATIATTLKAAMIQAGFTAIDDFTATNSDRVLVFSIALSSNATYGTIYIEQHITTTRIINQRMVTSWNSTTHTAGAIASQYTGSTTFAAIGKITFTSIQHAELRLVLLEQGTSTAQYLGIIRPALIPTWWTESTYPYAFIPTSNTLTNFYSFDGTYNPYGTSTAYPLLYISQLAANAPNNQPDNIAGVAMILSPNSKGQSGIFSSEVGLCFGGGTSKRGDMLGEYLLLYAATSGICLKSSVPA